MGDPADLGVDPGREGVRGLKLALGLYAVIFALKIAVYLATGVVALLAEALHTLSDIFISGFLLAAARYSRKAVDELHPFGHARAQNVAGLVAATLFISFTSYKLFEESIPRLFKAGEASYRSLGLALGVLVASMLIAAFPLVALSRQKERGAAAKAQLSELVNDELGLVAALTATILIANGHPLADPIASMTVATIIAVKAVFLFRENASFLLGRSPGPEFLSRIEAAASGVPGVLGIHDARAEYVGPDTVHAGLHIDVDPAMSVEDANRIADEVERRIHANVRPGHCVIHVDAARRAEGPFQAPPHPA